MAESALKPPEGRIRRLPPDAVNRIAAGEVVERPAAAAKELIENALDAGAQSIRVRIEGGGLTRLLVEDDGLGMGADELPVAIERHATSKLAADEDGHVDLLDIRTMGFRGEALPSIGSVSRLGILSKAVGADAAFAGKAFLWSLGALGEQGPAHFINILKEDLRATMGQLGCFEVSDLRAVARRHPGAWSASEYASGASKAL